MIIKALTSYYDRNKDILPPLGWEEKSIPFLIIIDEKGKFVDIVDTRENDRGKEYLVRHACVRTSDIKANLLWDNIEYALGCAKQGKGKPDKEIIEIDKKHQAFIERLLPIASMDKVESLIKFLKSPVEKKKMRQHHRWEIVSSVPNDISFLHKRDLRMGGMPLCADKEILEKILDENGDDELCIVTGEKQPTATLHYPIKGVPGAKETGARLVSFKEAPFCSYGKTQGENSPIGVSTMHRYTTALNHLLRYDSRQKSNIAGITIVWWARKETKAEDRFSALFNSSSIESSDNAERMKVKLKAPYTGADASDSDTDDFYVLGLSPNSARISVRLWDKTTVKEVDDNIKNYFGSIAIVPDGRKLDKKLSIFNILRDIFPAKKTSSKKASSEKIDESSRLLVGQFIRAIYKGLPYPRTLLQAAVNRCRAKQEITHQRAAIIKACLMTTITSSPEERKITEMLNPNETAPSYVLGRLFSVLERAQEVMQQRATPEGKTDAETIKDRYYGAASTNPVMVFPMLLKINHHHNEKLPSWQKKYFEKLIGEIVALLDAKSFPNYLTLEQQGRFAVGYYHQRQYLFTKKKEKENSDD